MLGKIQLEIGRFMSFLLLAFFIVLLAVSYQDLKKMEINDGCHIAIVVLAAAAVFTGREPGILSRLLGALCISVPMLALTLLIPGAFGGGDIKLMAAAGLFLGRKGAVISAVLAIFAAGIYALYLVMKRDAGGKKSFPLGPFLCAGMAAAALWGDRLWLLFAA